MLLRSTAPHINKYSLKANTERKKTKRKKVICPKSKFIRIGIFHREKKISELENFLSLNSGLPQRELPQREKSLKESFHRVKKD